MQVVQRRIFEQQDSRWNLDAAEQDVCRRAMPRLIRLPSRAVPWRRRRSDSMRRSCASRCSTAAPLRACASTPDTGRRRWRSRRGRSTRPPIGSMSSRIPLQSGRHWLSRLVGYAGEQLARRPRSHVTAQLRHEVWREDGTVDDVSDDDHRDDRQESRLNLGLRDPVGPTLDDVAALRIRPAQEVGEHHHGDAHRDGVVDGVLVQASLEQSESRNHVCVVEDSQAGAEPALNTKAQRKPTTRPDGGA